MTIPPKRFDDGSDPPRPYPGLCAFCAVCGETYIFDAPDNVRLATPAELAAIPPALRRYLDDKAARYRQRAKHPRA